MPRSVVFMVDKGTWKTVNLKWIVRLLDNDPQTCYVIHEFDCFSHWLGGVKRHIAGKRTPMPRGSL